MAAIKKYSPDDIKEIGRRVRTQREKMGISQKILGDNINVEKNVIQRIESGKLKSVNEHRLYYIASMLDCNPAYLLLDSDDPRIGHSNIAPYYDAPFLQDTAEHFLYSHMRLREDMAYMEKYMHKELQEQLVKIIHTFVLFHKCGVHYPNTTPKEASSINYDRIFSTIKDNFFVELHSKSKWERPRPSK